MPNKKYVSGRNFEYRVKKFLESKGCFVIRSAGSKGVADLVSIDTRGKVFLIQCKLHGQITSLECEELINISDSVKAIPILVSKNEDNNKLCWKNAKTGKTAWF